MSFGKLYTYEKNPRSIGILAVAKANGLEIETVHTRPMEGISDDYLKINLLKKIPTFVGSDGYVLPECMAIAIYVTSQNKDTTLLGKTKQEYASILQWMSYGNTELIPSVATPLRYLAGQLPYNKKLAEEGLSTLEKVSTVLESHLLVNTYLVGDRLTLADIFVTPVAGFAFSYFWDKAWREQHPNITRWYETIMNQPIITNVGAKIEWVETAMPNVPPKKEEKPKEQPKKQEKQEKKKAPEPEEEEEEDKPAPKPKHPLEALPKASFVLDDWKRKYSNEETREVALPWFWENCKFDEYSIWRVDYKYNNELTMTFMTSNLIGGFFARLEASRKYLFGAASVFGVTNDSVVRGAFVARGQEALPAFDVAPDFESYEFTKLDPTKAEDKEFVNDMWAWDKPIDVNGKAYEWADGKVFK